MLQMESNVHSDGRAKAASPLVRALSPRPAAWLCDEFDRAFTAVCRPSLPKGAFAVRGRFQLSYHMTLRARYNHLALHGKRLERPKLGDVLLLFRGREAPRLQRKRQLHPVVLTDTLCTVRVVDVNAVGPFGLRGEVTVEIVSASRALTARQALTTRAHRCFCCRRCNVERDAPGVGDS